MENITFNDTDFILENAYLKQLNEKLFRIHLPAIIYTAILMLFGLPGNFVVIYVYFFKWRRSTSRIFILYLALLDLVNCLTTLPMEIYLMRYSVMLDIPFVCKLSRFSTYTMNGSSALILLGIAVDRFKRICRPYQRTFSEDISKYICIGAIVLSVILTCPCIILYGTRKVYLGNMTGNSCLIQNKYDSTPYPIIFFGIMGLITFIIFTTLSVLYYCVGMQIYKHRQFKQKNCSHVTKIAEEASTEKSQNPKSANGNEAMHSERDDALQNRNALVSENSPEPIDKSDNEIQNKQPTINQLHVASTNPSNDFQCLTTDGASEIVEAKEANNVSGKNSSPVKRTKNRMRVRYTLVRGSSTINSSGRTRCVNCLTVRVGKSTFMLFLITLAYIISFLPFYTIVIIRQSNKAFVQTLSVAGAMAYHLFLRSYLLASAINPIIYSFCNPQFRGHCINLFKRLFSGETGFSERIWK